MLCACVGVHSMKLFVVCVCVVGVCACVLWVCVQVMLILFELMGLRAVLDLVAAALTERKLMCACVVCICDFSHIVVTAVCLCVLVCACVCVFMCVFVRFCVRGCRSVVMISDVHVYTCLCIYVCVGIFSSNMLLLLSLKKFFFFFRTKSRNNCSAVTPSTADYHVA